MIRKKLPQRGRSASWSLEACGLVVLLGVAVLHAHFYVPQDLRSGAYPAYPGQGWIGEVWLNLPNEDVEHLLVAEQHMNSRPADFQFKTQWIDFPMGPVGDVADADLDTVGDLLDGYIYDVSDPSRLTEPMSNLVMRFTGMVKVTFQDESRILGGKGLPVWMDFGSYGFDGYRTSVAGVECYRRINTNEFETAWFNFGPSIEVLGLYPIEVTYFNNYDPKGVRGAPRGGFELYSWHGSPYDWPAADIPPPHSVFGPMTLAPPWPIYQPGDELPMERGDFDGDADIDLEDYQWLQICFDPTNTIGILAAGCDWVDFNLDLKLDLFDVNSYSLVATGP